MVGYRSKSVSVLRHPGNVVKIIGPTKTYDIDGMGTTTWMFVVIMNIIVIPGHCGSATPSTLAATCA
jgi:hypothetical protein